MNTYIQNLLESLLDKVTEPEPPAAPGTAQSLGQGAAGIALLHLERAATGDGAWQCAHTWIRAAVSEPVSASPRAGLYAGAGAIAFVLDTAERVQPNSYARQRDRLLAHLSRVAEKRLNAAADRIRHGRCTSFAEYDLITGLTGIGLLFLRTRPESEVLGRILHYLAALTEPVRNGNTTVPGWWVEHDPDPLLPTPGGHLNFGLAHGITGPLALMALAYREGRSVDGQREAINAIVQHLHRHAHHDNGRTWWPQWTTNTAQPIRDDPPRPSWCYGTPGIARALQLGAIALGDAALQHHAEHALALSLTDTAHIQQLTGTGLCHGWAGAYLTAARAAADAVSPALPTALPTVTERFSAAASQGTEDLSLLDGAAGIALAAQRLLTNAPSTTGWESCLLI